MPDLNFILSFDQNDVFHHFLILAPFLPPFCGIYRETLLRSYTTDASNGMVFFNTNIGFHGRQFFHQMAPFGYQHLLIFLSEIHAYSCIPMAFSAIFSMV